LAVLFLLAVARLTQPSERSESAEETRNRRSGFPRWFRRRKG